MPELSDRINHPISTAELERRWTAVRSAMDARGIDVLVTQSSNPDWGYVRYLADLPHSGYGTTVIFPRSEPMTVVVHGPLGGDVAVDPAGDGELRGVQRVLMNPYFPAAHFTQQMDTDLTSTAMRPYGNRTVGVVGANHMPSPLVDSLRRDIAGGQLVDATDLVDEIKVIKSEEEQVLIRRTAQLQDAAMSAAIAAIKPGARDRDVAAAAEHVSRSMGSEYGVYMVGSSAPGDPAARPRPAHQQERVIQAGDIVAILVENSGPGGYYCELGRTAVLGRAPHRLLEEHVRVREAQQATLDRLRPGVSCAEIWQAHNDHMTALDRPIESRIHAHGQGYDLVERPVVRFDEPMPLRADMNITCHPAYVHEGLYSWICDNHLTRDGAPEAIHSFTAEITEV